MPTDNGRRIRRGADARFFAERLRRVLCLDVFALCLGLCYGRMVRSGRFVVPCVFRALTGLKCPACGVTGLCLALLEGDARGAFGCNPALLCLLPAFACVGAVAQARWTLRRSPTLTRGMRRLLTALYGVLLCYGVARNLPGAPFV